MNIRYQLVHYLIPLLPLFLLTASCKETSTDKKTSEKKPNILFILADDLGYHDLSIMGSDFYETPNIDQIASKGIIFREGYASCQVCSPSRASIMTGQFPARHGITDWIGARSGEEWRKQKRFNKLLPADYRHQLDSSLITLPEALREEGYTTFFAGKWHLGDRGSWPEDHGFDINKGGYERGGPAGGYFDPYKNPKLPNRNPGENLSMRLASETVSFLQENNPETTEKPFFAYLSFYAVHGPIQTTREKWRKYRDKAVKQGLKDQGFEMAYFLPQRLHQDNPVYAGLVEAMDDAVGMVMDELKRLGLDQNTIIVFTSDNGGVVSGDAYATTNDPLRGGKGYQYEGGIREPYFMVVPGLTEPGQVSDIPATGTDFYPTLLDLAGAKLKPKSHLDGVSLAPVLRGDSIPKRPLIWHYPHYGNQGGRPSSIIREGNWKLIHYYEDSTQVLYDLSQDLGETTDLTMQYPSVVQDLNNKLFTYLREVNAEFPLPDPEYSAEKEELHLKSVRTKKWPQLEKRRTEYLSDDFSPNNNWWGSEPASN